jgi:hypothetical protein
MSNRTATPILQAVESQQPEQYPHSSSKATRHLCAGVYLDRSFRDRVIRQIHNDSRRRIAPSYGFDLVSVVRHAWRSWFLDAGFTLTTANCLLGGLMLGHQLAVVIVMCTIIVCLLISRATRLGAKVSRAQYAAVKERWFERHKLPVYPETTWSALHKRKRRLKAVLAGCVAVAVTPILMSILLGASLKEAMPAATKIGFLLVASAVLVGVQRQLLLNAIHSRDSLRPPVLTRREQVIDEQQSHPCVIYHRPEPSEDTDPLDFFAPDDEQSPFDDRPFIGSGILVHRWLPPVTIQLLRPGVGPIAQREHATPPFTAHELVEWLRAALQQLGTDPDPEHLPGLQVRDRLYIAEADLGADRRLLRSRPSTFVLWRVIDDHRSTTHHFLEISAPIADGELVTTVLLRVGVKGRCLSLDFATCALTRTLPKYQLIDAFAEHGTSAVLRSAMRSVFALPTEFTRLWRLVEIPWVLARAGWAVKDRTGIPRRGKAVGARVAVREECSEDWENAQLDTTVIYEHMKIIEQRILKATKDFLEDHEVDVSMFEKQAMNIINSGVLNMGGRQEVRQSAVGESKQIFLPPEMEGKSAWTT